MTEPKAKPIAKTPPLVDERLVEMLSHPTRTYLLNAMTQRAAVPTDLAREMGEDPTAVAYHVKRLLEAECIEPVGTKKVGGATAVLYRATVRHYFDAEAWKSIPRKKRHPVVINVVRLISKDVGEAIQAETITADDVMVSRTPMRLDTAGWMETQVLLARAEEELLAIRERAAGRLGESDETPRICKAVLLGIETPDAKL